MATPNKNTHIKTINGDSIAIKLIASIVPLEQLLVLLDKKGRQLNSSKIDGDNDKGSAVVDALIETVTKAAIRVKDPFTSLPNGNLVRVSAIEAVQTHKGRDFKGLLIRGEDDSILSFLDIPEVEVWEKVANALHDVIESFGNGKFIQPDWAVILKN